ncbi:MAG: hypothetical protein WCA22_23130 [Candidatus Binatus sp.]
MLFSIPLIIYATGGGGLRSGSLDSVYAFYPRLDFAETRLTRRASLIAPPTTWQDYCESEPPLAPAINRLMKAKAA